MSAYCACFPDNSQTKLYNNIIHFPLVIIKQDNCNFVSHYN